MNFEVVKVMNRKPARDTKLKRWWRKNRYKVLRIILFPLWFYEWSEEKIEFQLNSRNQWDEKRAFEILNYYIPRSSHWNPENNTFYFFDNGDGWSMYFAKKRLKRKDRRFWNLNAGFGGYKMREYLINNFELDGFSKEVGNCYDGWTEITFRMKMGG